MIRRRQFVAGIGSALAGTATRLGAQPTTAQVRRVGHLAQVPPQWIVQYYKPMRDELGRLGWVEGRNVVYDVAAAPVENATLPRLADELVARSPHVIVVGAPAAALAAKRATTTIPIVFIGISTPVEDGVVSNLARPGGNVTGVSPGLMRLLPKRIQLLRDILPDLKRIGILRVPVDPVLDRVLADIEPALRPLGVAIIGAGITDAADIEPAVTRLAAARVGAIIDTMTFGVTLGHRERVIELTNRARVPYVASWDLSARAGALFSYAGSADEQARAGARLIDKVFRGASPADIPVESVNAYDLVVNLKAARLLGITVPQSVLLRATRVIE